MNSVRMKKNRMSSVPTGRPAHAQAAKQGVQSTEAPVPGVSDGPLACKGFECANEPVGELPGFHATAEPSVTEPLESLALIGEEDGRVKVADLGVLLG